MLGLTYQTLKHIHSKQPFSSLVILKINFSIHSRLRIRLVERWKSERIENWERMKKWEDRRDFSFPRLCLVGRMEKWRDGKLFYLVEKKTEKIENRACINLPSYPY